MPRLDHQDRQQSSLLRAQPNRFAHPVYPQWAEHVDGEVGGLSELANDAAPRLNLN